MRFPRLPGLHKVDNMLTMRTEDSDQAKIEAFIRNLPIA